jgi:signal transduction histidine kinase/ActR/RegA family two-component response regulator
MKLRTRLFHLIVGTMVPLILLAGVLSYLLVEGERDAVRHGALARNRAVMTAVDTEIRGHIDTLNALATSKSLHAADPREFEADAVRFMNSQPAWQNVVLDLPDGRQAANARYGKKGPATSSDPESVRETVRRNSPLVANLVKGRTSGVWGIPLRIPITRDGKVIYILTAIIKPATFQRLLESQNIPPTWVTGLVDTKGRLIARMPPRAVGSMASTAYLAAVEQGGEGWYRGLTIEGADTYTAHQTSALSRWSIGFAVPSSEVLMSAHRAAWFMGLGTLLTILLAFGFAWWMGRRITGPISSLAVAARHLGRPGGPAPLDAQIDISEVREVAQVLDDASRAIEREQDALRAADRAKDEFLAMLGHELRNPLAAITASAYVLRLAKPGDEVAVEARNVIERQTKLMTRLIEDLLDLSRVVMGKVTLRQEPFDLAELVTRVTAVWQETRSRRIVLSAAPVWVNADRERIEQILSNLIDNAHKFSPSGTSISITLYSRGREAVLELRDQGEGIPAEDLENIFGLFVQGPRGPDRARGGMGVGLALVRRLIEMHGGSVVAESEGTGHGATFTVRLPVVSPPVIAVKPYAADPVSPAHRRVLVVEDNNDAREMLRALLTLEGHSVRTAENGAIGLREAGDWRPDIALLDIGLPDIDGYELARRLRESSLGTSIRLIALSGYGQSKDEERALEAGFDLHLTKPVQPELLKDVIAALTRTDADRYARLEENP